MTNYRKLWREMDKRIEDNASESHLKTILYMSITVICIVYMGFSCVGCAGRGISDPKVGNVPCNTQTIYVSVDEELPQVYDQWTQRSVDYWNAQIGRRVLVYVGRSRLTVDDQPNMIVVRRASEDMRNEWDLIRRWGSTNSTRAHSPTEANPKPCIVRASVFVRQPGDDVRYSSKKESNNTVVWYSDPDKVLKMTPILAYRTLLHEVGHVCGLMHSSDRATIMHFPFDRNNAQAAIRNLGEDAYPALEAIYGADIR